MARIRRTAVAAAAFFALSAPGASAQTGGPACVGSAGPVAVRSVDARIDGDWRDVSGDLCGFVDYMEPEFTPAFRYASFGFLLRSSYSQDLSALIPPGTRMRVRIESSGAAPMFALGAWKDGAAAIDDHAITIEGATTGVKYAREYDGDGNPNCGGTVDSYASFFDGLVQLEGDAPTAGDLSEYRGAFFGSNAQTLAPPIVGPDGQSIEVDVTGCGDGDPSTDDGFFQAFLPNSTLQALGFGQKVIDQLTDPVAEELIDLQDNGHTVDDADVTVTDKVRSAARNATQTPDGLTIDYTMSFSSHRLVARPDRKNLKAATKCLKSKSKKLKVTGKGKKRKLTCVAKRKKR